MKPLLWLLSGIVLLVTGCKHEEPTLQPTEINMTVMDENRKPIPNAEIIVYGSTGSYFGGTRKDTTLVRANQLLTNSNGFASYKALIDSKWEIGTKPLSPYDNTGFLYELVKLEGTIHDAVVKVGAVNNITATMRKR